MSSVSTNPGSAEGRVVSNAAVKGRRRSGFAWTESVSLGLVISLVVGLIYALILMGPAPLNPHNTGWMIGDPAMYYIGWELLRQDPHWHWPLTYTDRVGYPRGDSVALMDLNPLLAVLLKPLSPLLPEPFQYFGIEVILICVLQFFFATRLFRLILGPNPLGIFLCSLFFLVGPPLIWNLTRHFAVSNHWLIIAALLIYFQAQQESAQAVRRFIIPGLTLAALAAATNPYVVLQVVLVLTATAMSLLWQHRLKLRSTVAFMAGMGLICAMVGYSLGFFITGGKGLGGVGYGYREFSLSLLGPFDPYTYGSILSRLLPHFPRRPIYPGCAYLGAGVIFLGILILILFGLQPEKRPSLDKHRVVPLLLCCVTLTLIAFSTRVTLGSATLIDFDPRQHLTPLLGALRMSVYLFWVPYYVFLVAVLAAPFLLFRTSRANALLALVLVIQLIDITPLLRWAHSRDVPSEIDGLWKVTELQPLKSPVWSKLGSVHQNLIVLPAWQCSNPPLTPGGLDGYRIFGFLAAAQEMRTNSYRPGPYTSISRAFHCEEAIAALAKQPLSPDSAYVVTPSLEAVIERGPTGPGKCHKLDGFILCSSKTEFGLGDQPK